MAELRCIVVTPERTVRDEAADFVALPLFDGEIGIAPGRAPLIGRLGYGEMRLKRGDLVSRFYVEGGFVEVVGDVVSVLTNRAILATEIDPRVAQEQLARALERPANSPELATLREQAVAQARAQLHAAERAR